MEGERNNMSMGMENGNASGPIVGGIVILVLIILGGVYFWNQRNDSEAMDGDSANPASMQYESDSSAAIESDLNETDVDYLDAELNAS